MQIDDLRNTIEKPGAARDWLSSLGITRIDAGQRNLQALAELGLPHDLLTSIGAGLENELPRLADPDMALNNLERFLSASRSPLATAALFERDPGSLSTLLVIFSTSQYLSDLLITDPGAYELVRTTGGQPVAREFLVDELSREVEELDDARDVMSSLRRFKRRETLRIAYGDIVREQPVSTVSRQISYLADAIVEAALKFARRKLEAKHGIPHSERGERVDFVVLALGKLGGQELNYSSDIDLIFVYGEEGQTNGPRTPTNHEFFERLARELVKLLAETTDLGFAYRVDLRLRPEGARGPAAIGYEAALTYYDNKGRTWERQAFIKSRAIAGDLELGHRLLSKLEPWIYRRFLSRADVTGIKALKRRIEQSTEKAGGDELDVKTGRGGIRDIEFVIQFLQLINGSDLPDIRTGNTLEAIHELEQAGCLTPQERLILEPNYEMLRKLEHRLQILYDIQTHRLPTDTDEQRKIAMRMGYGGELGEGALEAFEEDRKHRTNQNRKILDHLLYEAFGTQPECEPEVDLINDPDPSPERIAEVLAPYGFTDPKSAYDNLMSLANEPIRLLSTRRCRHFLATIAPDLLDAVATTPDPAATLVNLSRVSDSLGGKAALWELFSFNRPSMDFYVTLCAACPYLAGILTSNPGMIDELVDSLLLANLPTLAMLEDELTELTRAAEDIDPILHSFKDAQHLRVGVRDILGKDDVQATHRALSDVAEACVHRVAEVEFYRLVEKFGLPTVGEPPEGLQHVVPVDWQARVGTPCEFVILALGKLGGREPNYHSDLDLVFLYETDGSTVPPERGRQQATRNAHFFSELGQRIIKRINQVGPQGRLFEIDMRLRPTGRSGALSLPLHALYSYFVEGSGQLWERQSLCKARVIFGKRHATQSALDVVHQITFGTPWDPSSADKIYDMRLRLEETASNRNLKRGPGGTVDLEFIVQMLQLKHGGRDLSVRMPGTLNAVEALRTGGYLSAEDADLISGGYRFLRSIEARIRLMDATGRHELPPLGSEDLAKLAYLLDVATPEALETEATHTLQANRALFNRIFGKP